MIAVKCISIVASKGNLTVNEKINSVSPPRDLSSKLSDVFEGSKVKIEKLDMHVLCLCLDRLHCSDTQLSRSVTYLCKNEKKVPAQLEALRALNITIIAI